MKYLTFLAVFNLNKVMSVNVRENFGEDRVVSIQTEHMTSELLELLHSKEADHFGTGQDKIMHFKLPADVAEEISSQVESHDSTEHWINHFEENLKNENLFCADEPGNPCSKRELQSFYSQYQTLAAYHERVDDLAAASSLATIGSIGTSYEGRDLKLVTIADDGEKPVIFYFCNIHAREWITPSFCVYLVENLLADGGHPLLDTFTFAIVPSANPDGYEYSRLVNNLWRKTRKPNPGSSCVGTDPNRNYDANFGGIGSSSDPCSETYAGQSAFDNVEVAAIANFASSLGDRLIVHQDVHAYAQMFLSPYGYTQTLPPDVDYSRMMGFAEAAADAVRATNGLIFEYGAGSSILYYTSGSSKDWFYDTLGVVYTYTTECRGNSFQPATSQIMLSNTEIFAAMEASLEYVIETDLGGGAPTPPTIPPTNFPTAGCSDNVPSGLLLNGVPTECVDLSAYCAGYSIVRERCQFTCGTCALQGAVQSSLSLLRGEAVEILPQKKINIFVWISAGLGVALSLVGALVKLKQ
eukprot:snap_masked-scaffold_31-processed-gene-3.1-mRNA-1 protein AED:1.00 eAED:1.00 QI:0/-1/0/0/-1/1/1/0/524